MSILSFSDTTGLSTSSCYATNFTINPPNPNPFFGTLSSSETLSISNNQSKIMQNKVVVFKVTRNDKNEIISTEFLKEMWVQTKDNQKVDFEVARDKDLANYKAEELDIRVLLFVNF